MLDNFPVPCKDSIERLTNQWLGCVTPRGQPFGLIREYYGEKMALYFQFSGYGEARPVYEPTLPSHTNAFLISLSHPYLTLIEHVSDAYLLPLSPLSRLYLTLSMPPHPHLSTSPLLIIGTTRDPATPYRWAQGLHKELLGSTLITLNGDGHTGANRGSACVDKAMNTYLLTGKIPNRDITCDTDAALAGAVGA